MLVDVVIEAVAQADGGLGTKIVVSIGDLGDLHWGRQERSGDPYLLAALRPGPLLHSRYCAAMVQVLTMDAGDGAAALAAAMVASDVADSGAVKRV